MTATPHPCQEVLDEVMTILEKLSDQQADFDAVKLTVSMALSVAYLKGQRDSNAAFSKQLGEAHAKKS